MPSIRRSRIASVAAALATAAATALVVPLAISSSTVDAGPDDVVAIVIEGTGNGHGRGMSQWGAYGHAVDYGWTWNQILDHYFGGTIAASTPAGQRIRVRLTGYDGLGDVGVISHGSGVRWGSAIAPAMRAVEVTAGVFDVYSASAIACPSATSITVPDGPVVKAPGYNPLAADVQRFLKIYIDSSIVVDGYFGNQTAAVLAAWQTARGLPVNGELWDLDDATAARAVIAASNASVTWTKIGTHAQTVGNPVRFTAAEGDDPNSTRDTVLGVCASSGAVAHYRGAIDVVHTSSGNRVTNDVLAEGYLRGVVPKEIASSWAAAGNGAGVHAVRAQAVAARSYGLAQSRAYTYDGSATQYATTCDTTSCQVYGGAATRPSALAASTRVEQDATDAAIRDTANVVRTWPSGHPRAGQVVSTEFSASNGPRTAGGAFPAVTDLGDATRLNPNHRWTRIIDASTFAATHGLGTITGASMETTQSPGYQGFDGIWFDDIVVTGTAGTFRQQAWDFRNDNDLLAPGFTVRVVRRQTTSKTLAVIGDSVANSVTNAGGEFPRITDGTFASQTYDVVDSRCTTNPACPGPSGVEAARGLPSGLDLVVVELGYNDNPSTFASAIDAMMTELNARGARRVAWVNMADLRLNGSDSYYAAANAALNAATTRWPTLTVLDWNAAINTPELVRWLATDGVHLTATGRAEFALWLRSRLLELSPAHFLAPPQRIELPVVGESMTAPDGRTIIVPGDAAAVALNVTIVRPTGKGFATVWPCQAERPTVSSVNFASGTIVANNVIAPVSQQGTVCLYSSVGTHIVVDIAGWFPGASSGGAAAPFVGLLPQRLVDTRDGLGAPAVKVTPALPLRVPVAGLVARRPDGSSATVPADAAAVAVNVAIAQAGGKGFATVWPCSSPMPVASNVNFDSSAAFSNGVVAPMGTTGDICIHVSVAAHVIVDLAGFLAGGTSPSGAAASPPFTAATPTRVVDTRTGVGAPAQFVQPASPLVVEVTDAVLTNPQDPNAPLSIPAGASAVALNLTAVRPTGTGFATVWPCGTGRPVASNLNFRAGENRANSVIAPVGADGTICVYVDQPSHVLVDVAGWFRGGVDAGFIGAVPERLVDTRVGFGPVPT